jgi:hypothetical protein
MKQVALTLTLLLSGPVLAADGVLKLAGKSGYHERLEERTLVSGGTVLGVQSALASAKLDPRKLSVYLAPAKGIGELLCVEVTTSGGQYWSRNAYRLVDLSGWTSLETGSRHVSALESVREPAFAMRAELRKAGQSEDPDQVCARANREPPVFLLAGVGNSTPSPVWIMLNAKKTPAKVEIATPAGDARSLGTCERLRDIATRAYDTRCKVTLPGSGAGRYAIRVTLTEPGEDADVQRAWLLVP